MAYGNWQKSTPDLDSSRWPRRGEDQQPLLRGVGGSHGAHQLLRQRGFVAAQPLLVSCSSLDRPHDPTSAGAVLDGPTLLPSSAFRCQSQFPFRAGRR